MAGLLCLVFSARAQQGDLSTALFFNERGNLLMDEGNFQEAAEAFGEALALYPPEAETSGRAILLHNLTDALVSQGRLSEAVAVLDGLDSLSVSGELELEMNNLRANLLSSTGRNGEAIALWRNVLRKGRGSVHFSQYARNAASAELADGDTLMAQVHLSQALSHPNSPRDSLETYLLLVRMGQLCRDREMTRYYLSIAESVAARACSVEDYDYYLFISAQASVLEGKERYKEAAAKYAQVEKGLASLLGEGHPKVFSAQYGKARCLLGASDNKAAVKAYLKYMSGKQDFLAKEMAKISPANLRAVWIQNREGVIDAPLFAAVADAGSLSRIFDMVLLSKSFTFDCMREVAVHPQWSESARKMPAKAVCVEFADYTGLHGESLTCAFLYRKGDRTPKFIPLPNASSFEKSSGDLTEDGLRAIYDAIWAPVLKRVKSTEKIYFSPSASLAGLPIEYALAPDGKLLCAQFPLVVRILTTRDVPSLNLSVGCKKAVLFGEMDYHTQIGRGGLPAWWPNLPSSPEEMSGIVAAAGEVPVTLYKGADASEQNFRGCHFEKGQDVVLYLSTHGWTTNPAVAEQYAYFQNRYSKRDLEDNPLLRSVMVFSGANMVWRHGRPAREEADATLSAQEVSEMDFSGVPLVVLSACETGLSDKDPEVLGFPRAFKLAGAGATVAGLWQVNDLATAKLMIIFMKAVFGGAVPESALRSAIEELRKDPAFERPYYWAPFVVFR